MKEKRKKRQRQRKCATLYPCQLAGCRSPYTCITRGSIDCLAKAGDTRGRLIEMRQASEENAKNKLAERREEGKKETERREKRKKK